MAAQRARASSIRDNRPTGGISRSVGAEGSAPRRGGPARGSPLDNRTDPATGPVGHATVGTAQGDGRRRWGGVEDHVDGYRAVRSRTVPELPVLVVAPALHLARRGQSAGVVRPRRDPGDPGRQAAHVHRGGAVRDRAVAELAVVVVPPARGPARRRGPAGVGKPYRDPGHAPPRPLTSTGVLLSVFVPLPSWPRTLYPQHFAPPVEVMAQDSTPPAATPATPLERPLTSTGTELVVFVPFPSSPTRLFPQHFTPPSAAMAQAWDNPTATAVAPPERPITSTGVEL